MDISPPEPLNFAQHLFQINAGRAAKIAYVDDRAGLSYGELEQRSRRFAAALLDLGIRREERVLLLMLDANEWPVSFLGCLYAGIVPVAVNTLLTADDYAYMLAHSRAQAAIVSAALAPLLGKVDCPCCQKRNFEWLEGAQGSQTTSLCGRNAVQITPTSAVAGQVDLAEIAARLSPHGSFSHNKFMLRGEFRIEFRTL
jgi:acyl-CoA synthetase (AMP-forming)/AMP-acid ligase II